MTERNLCKEAGCSAACCRGAYLTLIYPVSKVLGWFPNAIEVAPHDLPEPIAEGVYYEITPLGSAWVRIVGNCPNLGTDDNCQIYKNRPRDCANLKISSKECSKFRRLIGFRHTSR